MLAPPWLGVDDSFYRPWRLGLETAAGTSPTGMDKTPYLATVKPVDMFANDAHTQATPYRGRSAQWAA